MIDGDDAWYSSFIAGQVSVYITEITPKNLRERLTRLRMVDISIIARFVLRNQQNFMWLCINILQLLIRCAALQ